jgi:predicted Mrr-cat superfamily restriction endonuclease
VASCRLKQQHTGFVDTVGKEPRWKAKRIWDDNIEMDVRNILFSRWTVLSGIRLQCEGQKGLYETKFVPLKVFMHHSTTIKYSYKMTQ